MIQLLLTSKSFNDILFGYYYKLGYSEHYPLFKLLSNACKKLAEYEEIKSQLFIPFNINFQDNVLTNNFLCFTLLKKSYSTAIHIYKNSNYKMDNINKYNAFNHVLYLLKNNGLYYETASYSYIRYQKIPRCYANVGKFAICMYNIFNHLLNNNYRIKLIHIKYYNVKEHDRNYMGEHLYIHYCQFITEQYEK